MSTRSLHCLLPLLLLGAAASPASPQEAVRGISASSIRAHLRFLSDDLLEGRAPGSSGAGIAAQYIISQLAHSGVEPVRGSYVQHVPLLGWTAATRRGSISVGSGSAQVTIRQPADAVLWLDSGADSALVRGELVFVGYGTRAPEYQWDDYKGRDVRGRIVVVLSGDPPAPPGQPLIFDGDAMTYYGRWAYKIEEAERNGAAGVVLVHTENGAGYPWSVVQSSWSGEQIALNDSITGTVQIKAWTSFAAARRLLTSARLDLQELYVRAARRDFQPVFSGVTAELRTAGRTRAFDSSNVVGMITGRHAVRRNEAVVYTAHYDHLGIGRAVNGDSVYNGAYDNASGVALLLEIAEAFASLATRPDRSVIFLFTTAEEAGMLGATWYVRHPLVPIQQTVAALNIDGANVWGETDDVGAVGLERSSLGVIFERQAAAFGLRVSAERAPQKGFFFRSDHFPFALAGVPALYLDHGTSFRGRPAGWGDAVLSDYEAEHYHQPDDEYRAAFDLAGAAQQGRHAFRVGLEVAGSAERPRWYSGGRVVTAPSGGR